MKLSNLYLSESRSRPHQFRGTTSIGNNPDDTAIELVAGAQQGNMDGRYFTYDDPKGAAKYSTDSLLIEVDIDPSELVHENSLPIAMLNDSGLGNPTQNDLNDCINILIKNDVPQHMIDQFKHYLSTRDQLANDDEQPIYHYDGKSSREISAFSRKLSQYLIESGAQVTLHHRSILPNELVAVYRVGFMDNKLQELSDAHWAARLYNAQLQAQLGLGRHDITEEQRNDLRRQYMSKMRKVEGYDKTIQPQMNFVISGLCFVSGIMLTLLGVLGTAWGFEIDPEKPRIHWIGIIFLTIGFMFLILYQKTRQWHSYK